MSDFLTKALANNGVVPREVEIGGETGTAYFRAMTAGQREQLLVGKKISSLVSGNGKGGTATVEIDLCDNEKQRQMLVQFCVCNQDGSPFFANVKAVKELSSQHVEVLAEHARIVNGEGEDDDLGKS